MNKKSMIILICWITLCVGLIIFMIVHIAVQQHLATIKQNENSMLALYEYFLGGKSL